MSMMQRFWADIYSIPGINIFPVSNERPTFKKTRKKKTPKIEIVSPYHKKHCGEGRCYCENTPLLDFYPKPSEILLWAPKI
jgi:hypothetical protein